MNAPNQTISIMGCHVGRYDFTDRKIVRSVYDIKTDGEMSWGWIIFHNRIVLIFDYGNGWESVEGLPYRFSCFPSSLPVLAKVITFYRSDPRTRIKRILVGKRLYSYLMVQNEVLLPKKSADGEAYVYGCKLVCAPDLQPRELILEFDSLSKGEG